MSGGAVKLTALLPPAEKSAAPPAATAQAPAAAAVAQVRA